MSPRKRSHKPSLCKSRPSPPTETLFDDFKKLGGVLDDATAVGQRIGQRLADAAKTGPVLKAGATQKGVGATLTFAGFSFTFGSPPPSDGDDE